MSHKLKENIHDKITPWICSVFGLFFGVLFLQCTVYRANDDACTNAVYCCLVFLIHQLLYCDTL